MADARRATVEIEVVGAEPKKPSQNEPDISVWEGDEPNNQQCHRAPRLQGIINVVSNSVTSDQVQH